MLAEESPIMNREFKSRSTITHALGAGAALLATVAILWSMEALAGHIYVEQEHSATADPAAMAHRDQGPAYRESAQSGNAGLRGTSANAIGS
jgi:hypothetical protein